MEELGLQEDTTDVKQELSDSSNSPDSKRRRLMSDSSSSLPDDQDMTFGSPEPPIPMPVPDVKKEEEGAGLTGGIVMPTAPPVDEATDDKDKPGPSSGGGDEEGAGRHGDGDKETVGGDDAPREEKTKEELAEEERQKMQVLVSSFSEEQLNRYEMYRRSSFPKAAIKRTVASDPNSGQKRAESLTTTSQQPPLTASSDNAHAGAGVHPLPQPAQTHAGLPQVQQHTVNHQSSIPLSSSSSTSTSNPNAAA